MSLKTGFRNDPRLARAHELAQLYNSRHDAAYYTSSESSTRSRSEVPSESASTASSVSLPVSRSNVQENAVKHARDDTKRYQDDHAAVNARLNGPGFSRSSGRGKMMDMSFTGQHALSLESTHTLRAGPSCQPSSQLYRAENSSAAYRSTLSSAGSSHLIPHSANRTPVRPSTGGETRLTDFPRPREPLFQYMDWAGLPVRAPVKRAPPVSFNRYFRDEQDPYTAASNALVDPLSGERVAPAYYDDSDKARLFRNRDCGTAHYALGFESEHTRSLYGQGSRVQSSWNDKNSNRPGVQAAHPVDSHLFSPQLPARTHASPPNRPLPPLPTSSSLLDRRMSDHTRTTSDSTNDSIPSITTDKLPNVTNPGTRAYYAQYLAASSLTGSPATSFSSDQVTPPPSRGRDLAASHQSTGRAVYPPQVNKPLPPTPTANGSARPVHHWSGSTKAPHKQSAVDSDHLWTNSTHLRSAGPETSIPPASAPHALLQPYPSSDPYGADMYSAFSESDDESGDTNVKVREIDQHMYGRVKYAHMRPGCKGWDAYRTQMLEESKGERMDERRPRKKESWIGRHVRKLSSSLS